MKHAFLMGEVVEAAMPYELHLRVHCQNDISWVSSMVHSNSRETSNHSVSYAGHRGNSCIGEVTVTTSRKMGFDDIISLHGERTVGRPNGIAQREPFVMHCRVITINEVVNGHMSMEIKP